MINVTKNLAAPLAVGLDYHGLLQALALLQTNPIWTQSLLQTDLLNRLSGKDHPEAIRLADFQKKVCQPLGIPFYILWVWMCTDFLIPIGEDPFVAADNYLKERLSPDEYIQVTTNKRTINLRKALRLKRTDLKLSLGQMAYRVGVERDQIAVLERKTNGTSMPRCDSLNAVLPAYELHPLELYVLALKEEDPYPKEKGLRRIRKPFFC